MILALLAVCLYAGWHLTNGARIRRQAETYIAELTGARVHIDYVKFSIFGPVELHHVHLHGPRGPAPAARQWNHPVLYASKVLLVHRPWSVFARGKLSPKEIVFDQPIINIEYDRQGNSNLQLLAKMLARRGDDVSGRIRPDQLPRVRIRRGKLQKFEPSDPNGPGADPTGLPSPYVSAREENTWRISAVMGPAGGDPNTYLVDFEERDPNGMPLSPSAMKLQGEVAIDLHTGEVNVTGTVPVREVASVLPQKLRKWLDEKHTSGEFTAQYPDPNGAVAIHLDGVGLEVELDWATVRVTDVTGTLAFDQRGVSTSPNLVGTVPSLGGARFVVAGRFGPPREPNVPVQPPRSVYDPNSPWAFDLRLKDARVPEQFGSAGPLHRIVQEINYWFQPRGTFDATAHVARARGERTPTIAGVVRPGGMTVKHRDFPYPFTNLRGEIEFTQHGAGDFDLTAGEAPVSVQITGRIVRSGGAEGFDARIDALNVPLDEKLRGALNDEEREVWDALNLAGRTSATVDVSRVPGGEPVVSVRVDPNGQASMAYEEFPYRLERLTGEVSIADRRVDITELVGRSGPLVATIRGQAEPTDAGPHQVALRVVARDLPLDKKLTEAFPAAQRELIRSLQLGGRAGAVVADVRSLPGKPTGVQAIVKLDGASMTSEAFPYALERLKGIVTVDPNRLVLRGVRGVHVNAPDGAETPVLLNGTAWLNRTPIGTEMEIKAFDVVLNDDLRSALPAEARRAWDDLEPEGLANITLNYQAPRQDDREPNYRLQIDATDASVRYRHLPIRFEHIRGRAVATPRRLVLDDLVSTEGEMTASLSGTVDLQSPRGQARLRLRGKGIEVSRELLENLPPSLGELRKVLEPAGRFDPNLELVYWQGGEGAASQPASRPASQPATGPSAPRWTARGQIGFTNVSLDVGLGARTLTGSASGQMSHRGRGLAIDAKLSLDRIALDGPQLTEVTGQLLKAAGGDEVVIRELSGRAHQGWLTGRAEVRLADPVKVLLSVKAREIDLRDLFTAGAADPNAVIDVAGSMDGSFQLMETLNAPEQRQAAGRIEISDGRIVKMPVMLGLLHVLYLSVPGDSVFEEGRITYHLKGNRLTFREIRLRGSGVAVTGSGAMAMDTGRLKINFLMGPRNLPGIEGLGRLLGPILQELVITEVTGTLDRPRMRTVPLRGLDEALRRVLSPGQVEL